MTLPGDGDQGIIMDCQKVEEQDIIERYLNERLSEPETEAFEQHYLECKRCFGELKIRHAAAIELTSPSIQLKTARNWWAPLSRPWAIASTAVALVILTGVLYIRFTEVENPPAQQIAALQEPTAAVLEQLASIDPIPPYIPGLIRGGETNPALIKFQEGMELYSMQKYAEAISPLTEAARLDPEREIIAFYLGVSYLAAGNPDGAIQSLSTVAARSNPYSEESHWYLAKAHLKKRDFRSARTELQTVQSLNGGHAVAAQDLLKQIQDF